MPSNEFSPSCGLCALSMQYAQIKETLPSKIVLCLGVTLSFDIFTGNYYYVSFTRGTGGKKSCSFLLFYAVCGRYFLSIWLKHVPHYRFTAATRFLHLLFLRNKHKLRSPVSKSTLSTICSRLVGRQVIFFRSKNDRSIGIYANNENVSKRQEWVLYLDLKSEKNL